RAVAAPLDHLLDRGGDHPALHRGALAGAGARHCARPGLLVVHDARVCNRRVGGQSHRRAPLRQTYNSPTSNVPMKMAISTTPKTFNWRTIVAQGNRKIDSTSMMMNSIAVT